MKRLLCWLGRHDRRRESGIAYGYGGPIHVSGIGWCRRCGR